MKLATLAAAVGGALALLAGGTASAQSFPTKPIRLIIPFAPGGSTDIVGRIAAERMGRELGHSVVVENRAGGGGVVGAEAIKAAVPDGYTIGMATVSTHGVQPVIAAKPTYDPLKDFIPITNLAAVPNVVAVNPQRMKARDMKSFLAELRSQPGKLSYASSGTGGIGHLMGETFKATTKTFILHIPYRGAGPALVDVVGGQVDMIFDNLPSSLPHIKAGKLIPIAVASSRRFEGLPNVPTYAELGMPECNSMAWYGLIAPARTPDAAVQVIYGAAVKSLADPDVRKRLTEQAAYPVGNTPAQFADEIRRELDLNRKVVKSQGLTLID